ncbi:hypothetical protein FH972_014527 [Carpinus fangiana]|uniref:LysM domain-containing protein n=1 Tax=Carpinus fangiana TaxID=176857 RepID=A0A5N6RDH2_9ROSI|nr:hypothetical protein FH972_014527 [Carpinus fangiana]
MAKCNNKTATFLNIILLLSLLLMVSIIECRTVFGIGFEKEETSTPECNSVYGAEDGDTCSTITQKLSLTADFFSAINPNLNCDKIFVGQWLCINGILN